MKKSRMKNSANVSERNIENSKTICDKVREEAEDEVRDILEKARKERDRILEEAKKEVFEKKNAMLKESDNEIERIKERVYSNLHLENSRAILGEKNEFAEEVLKNVNDQAQNFRSNGEYPVFLKKAVIEGLGIIDDAETEVLYSSKDSSIIDSVFIKDVEAKTTAEFKKKISIEFKKSDFGDIGVIVQARGGRRIYDNRFRARLKRAHDEIYMSLLKEVFQDGK